MLRRHFSLRVLVAIQLAAIVVLGGVTAFRFHIWADVDERAHYANVQAIAEGGRYPRQPDLVSADVQAITDGTYPRPSPNDPRSQGLAGRSYEAVQPPLYYLLAAPAFLAPVDYRHKVLVLRLFDLALLVATLALAGALCREVLGSRWRAGYTAVLATMLWPGVLVRMITISNDVLALPAGLLVALLAMRAWKRQSPEWLLWAGVSLGAALLTKATLVFMIPVLLATAISALRWRVAWARAAAVGSIVVALLIITPWLVANEVRYGTWSFVGGSPEVAALYPSDLGRGTGGVLPRVGRLTVASLPQEFSYEYEALTVGNAVTRGLVIALVAFGVAAALVARRRLGASPYMVLGLPVVAGVAGLIFEFERTGGDAFFGRYLYASAILFTLFGAAGWIAAGKTRVVTGWAVTMSVVAAVFWIHLAGAYYFLDVRDKIGI
jgi:4-amino-4-deoxy-L-arabinose transferase-like glycosyltransferase